MCPLLARMVENLFKNSTFGIHLEYIGIHWNSFTTAHQDEVTKLSITAFAKCKNSGKRASQYVKCTASRRAPAPDSIKHQFSCPGHLTKNEAMGGNNNYG